MNDKDIIKEYRYINSLIGDTRINEAVKKLKESILEIGSSSLLSKLGNIEETYKYMIRFLLDGFHDGGREGMLSEIKEKLYSLNDYLLLLRQSIDNNDYFYETFRITNYRKEKASEMLTLYGNIASEMTLAEAAGNDSVQIRRQREEVLQKLFDTFLTSYDSSEDLNELKSYILSGYADNSVSILAVNSLILSLLKIYDKAKVNFLLDIYENSENKAVAARALVGFVFAVMFYKFRIDNDAQIKSRIYLWNDSDETYRRLRETIRVIIGTIDTQRIADKMKNEVLPELIKLRPDIIKSLREGNLESFSPGQDNNPEWEEILEKSGLNYKLMELNEMQNEGADLMMVTFSNLKQFPFFNKASNWFMPFETGHSELNLSDDMKGLISFMIEAGVTICDSDLYSLAIASSMMPDSQKAMISNQMSAQMEQMKEEIKSRVPDSTQKDFNNEIIKSVREFYRFFKLFRKRDGFKNPFDMPVNFVEMPVIGEMLTEEDFLRVIAEFYFKRGYYLQALPYFNVLLENNPGDVTLLEKRGFSFQSLGDFEKAFESYRDASLVKEPSQWLTKRLAFICRKLGKYEMAVQNYTSALDKDPDNLSLIMNLGNVYLEMNNQAEAMQQFYHANYLDPENPKVLRALAWTELLNGNFAKSADYYRRIMAIDAKSGDYLNAGHVELLAGRYREALNYYRLASADDKKAFEQAFKEDIKVLEGIGLNPTTALLILDNI